MDPVKRQILEEHVQKLYLEEAWSEKDFLKLLHKIGGKNEEKLRVAYFDAKDSIIRLRQRLHGSKTGSIRKQIQRQINHLEDRIELTKEKMNGFKFIRDIGGAEAVLHRAGQVVLALGIAAGTYFITKAALEVYKKKFSEAAKACANLSGDQKSKCMLKYRRDALIAARSGLQAALGGCGKTSNPAKCSNALKKKIAKYNARIGDTQKQIG